jgi:hypothetical protein
VPDDRPFIIPVPFTDLSPALTAEGPFFAALNSDDQLANFVDFCAQYPHIGYIQWYRCSCSFHPFLPLSTIVSGAARRSDGTRVRVASVEQPSSIAENVAPNLEDAYLGSINKIIPLDFNLATRLW